MSRLIILLFLLLPLTVVASDSEKIRVFVSIPPQKQFVEKIGGALVDVQVMLPAGQSPETYTPSPRMLASLSGARLYFQIGVPFEVSWTAAIQSVNPTIKIATCCDQFIGAAATADDEHHDLHIWSSPDYVKRLAQQIRDELTIIDPAHQSSYETGFRQFTSELDALSVSISNKLSARRTRYFIVSHAAWGYFAEQFGLVQLALEENGKESGPRSLLDMIRVAHEEKIHTLFMVKQYQTPVVKSLARELDAVIVEMDPLADDYLANMVVVSDQIAGALK